MPQIATNEKLLPWQGAAAWIFELENGAPLSSLIQVREKVWPLFGSEEERLSHELCHVGRMGFEEKQYEEVLAYQTSTSPFRRFFGPLFQSNLDSILLVSLLGLIVVFDVVLLLSGSLAWYDQFMWMKLVPLVYLTYLLARLVRRQRTFQKVVSTMQSLPFVYCLLDEEINRFSTMTREEVAAEVAGQKNRSLRHRLLLILSAN